MDVWLEKGREEKERDKEEREYGRKRGEREEKEREDGGKKRDKRKEEIKDEGGRRERKVMVSHNYRNSQHLHIYSWLFL